MSLTQIWAGFAEINRRTGDAKEKKKKGFKLRGAYKNWYAKFTFAPQKDMVVRGLDVKLWETLVAADAAYSSYSLPVSVGSDYYWWIITFLAK